MQVSTTLDNISRDFIKRKYIFYQNSTDRIRPVGFEGVLYTDILKWIFGQCAVKEFFYRQKCMKIFILMLQESDLTCEKFFIDFLSIEKIVEMGESEGIGKNPNMEFSNEHSEPVFKLIYEWMKNLLSTIDFYVWLIQNNLLPSNEINKFLEKTVLLDVLKEFLAKDIIHSIDADNTQLSLEMKMNNRNLEKIEVMRSIIIIKSLDLFRILMQRNFYPTKIFDENQAETLKLVKNLIFKPQRLGIDYRTYNIVKDYDQHLANFVLSVNANSSSFCQALLRKLEDKIVKYFDDFIKRIENIFGAKKIRKIDESKMKGIR